MNFRGFSTTRSRGATRPSRVDTPGNCRASDSRFLACASLSITRNLTFGRAGGRADASLAVMFSFSSRHQTAKTWW